jgi:hypothetical protein
MKKSELTKIKKVITNIDIQLSKLERELELVPVFMKMDVWNNYKRLSNYKKELQNIVK